MNNTVQEGTLSMTPTDATSPAVTSPAPSMTPSLGWDDLFWTPYVALSILLIVLACASFLQYHRKHRGKYKEAEYKRNNHIAATSRKHRVTLHRKGRVICLTQPHLTHSHADVTSHNATSQNIKSQEDAKPQELNGPSPSADIFTVVTRDPAKKSSLKDIRKGHETKQRQVLMKRGETRFVGDSTSSNDDSGVVMDVVPKRARDRSYGNPPAGYYGDNFDVTGDVTALYRHEKAAPLAYDNRGSSFTAENGLCMLPAGADVTSSLRHHRGDAYSLEDGEEPV